jgi:hypothetical protein
MDQKHRNMHVMKYTCATKSIRSQRLKQPMCLVPNSFFPLPSLFFSSLKPLIPQLADERTFPYAVFLCQHWRLIFAPRRTKEAGGMVKNRLTQANTAKPPRQYETQRGRKDDGWLRKRNTKRERRVIRQACNGKMKLCSSDITRVI